MWSLGMHAPMCRTLVRLAVRVYLSIGNKTNDFGGRKQTQDDDEEAARLVAVGAGRVTGAAAPVNKRVKDRQTVFASATVPQHNHFIRQCVQVTKRREERGECFCSVSS